MTLLESSDSVRVPQNGLPSPWTDERIDLLKLRWSAGATASEIGGEMGLSRNAVIGKIHRLNLDARRVTVRLPDMREYRPHKQVRFRAVKPKPAIEPEMLVGEPAPNPVYSVDALTRTNCRWPYGDPDQPEFHFCGATSLTRRSYCGPHHRLAYQPKR